MSEAITLLVGLAVGVWLTKWLGTFEPVVVIHSVDDDGYEFSRN